MNEDGSPCLGHASKPREHAAGRGVNSRVEYARRTEENSGLIVPLTEKVTLYDRDQLMRTRLAWLTFGLLAALVLGGLIAITVASIAGGSTDVILDYLKTVVGPLFSLATFVAGFFFGRHTSRDTTVEHHESSRPA
jgi:hypothetical protein